VRWLPLTALTLALACSPADDPATGLDTATPGDDTDTSQTDGLAERVVIYQLVVRLFGNTTETRRVDGTLEQNGVGRFNDINQAAIEGLGELGVTHVWLTGIPRQATLTDWSSLGLPPDDPDVVKGRAGSFYAVRDYYDTSPDYAENPEQRLDELRALVERLHANDMQVLIDLVPNHVARGYGSVRFPERDFGVDDDQTVFFEPNNDFFYVGNGGDSALRLSRPDAWNPSGVTFDGLYPREDGSTLERTPKATGNRVTSTTPSASDWYETIKLNYGFDFTTGEGRYEPRPATWDKVDDVIAFWQEDIGVDGFRVDFAHFVPNPAWVWLTDQARLRDSDVYFVAEAYEDLDGLLASGFDVVYHDEAYDTLKAMYLGQADQTNLDERYLSLGDEDRHRWLHYLENHDERRIASPLVESANPDNSGFGSSRAARQLAPIQYLVSSGPVLFYNGQEVGEEGSGREGFGGDDGRTSIFDYWSLPKLQGWVNDHAYDGGGLTAEEAELRQWYAQLLSGPVHDPAVEGSGFWGLEYINNSSANPGFPDDLYTFARFEPDAGRIVVVVGNFRPGEAVTGLVRLPLELMDAAGLESESLTVRRVFDERGTVDEVTGEVARQTLAEAGFSAVIEDQASAVFVIE
jgi:glycosidase